MLGPGHAPGQVLAGDQTALAVPGVAVGVVGGAPERRHHARRLVPAQHPVVGDVAPDQAVVVAEPDRPLGPPVAGRDPFDRRVVEPVAARTAGQAPGPPDRGSAGRVASVRAARCYSMALWKARWPSPTPLGGVGADRRRIDEQSARRRSGGGDRRRERYRSRRRAALAGDGWVVVLAGRRPDAARSVAERGAGLPGVLDPVPADVTDEASVRALFDRAVERHRPRGSALQQRRHRRAGPRPRRRSRSPSGTPWWR